MTEKETAKKIAKGQSPIVPKFENINPSAAPGKQGGSQGDNGGSSQKQSDSGGQGNKGGNLGGQGGSQKSGGSSGSDIDIEKGKSI